MLGTVNREDGATLDIVTEDFWGTKQRAFSDVRVLNPLAPSLCTTSISSLYRLKEKEKRRHYDDVTMKNVMSLRTTL